MVVQMQVLSVDSLEMSPCLMLRTESKRFLFNVGDGTQRMCMEHKVRLAKLRHVFLTELRAQTLGGLPGMILTVSDTGKDALRIYGPRGTQQFLTATRHFLYRPDFDLQGIDLEPHVLSSPPANSVAATSTAASPASPASCYEDDEIVVCAIVTRRAKAGGVKRKLHEQPSSPVTDSTAASQTSSPAITTTTTDCVSYVVETRPQRGKFFVQKAKALGVPPGRLFGQLHAGVDVTLPDGRVVRSAECVSPTLPPSGCAIVTCPSIEYIDDLVQPTGGFQRYQTTTDAAAASSSAAGESAPEPTVQLSLVFHLARRDVLSHPKYVAWVARFGTDVQHVVLSHDACPRKSVYRASVLLQAQLHCVFPRAFPSLTHELLDAEADNASGVRTVALPFDERVVVGESMLVYRLTPAARRGVDTSACWRRVDVAAARAATAAVTERLGLATTTISKEETDGTNDDAASVSPSVGGRITFLGTGCAIPSKYRNVTGMYVELDRRQPIAIEEMTMDDNDSNDAWDGLMLDCGEGSYGQLVRFADGNKARVDALVQKLQCVWISHNHADHHLGLIRLLSERSRLTASPLLIIGPSPVEWWLNEFAAIDSTVAGTFRFVDNYCFDDTDERFQDAVAVAGPTRAWLRETLGITNFECVPVKHAFRAYAIVLTLHNSRTIAFSGDCRPSDEFAAKARGAFLLVHEATFEDALSAEAESKNHCTTTEAIGVGIKAEATHVILTHFSQRYPKMPVVVVAAAAAAGGTINDSSDSVDEKDDEKDDNRSTTTSDVLMAIDLLSLRFDEFYQPQLMDVCAELMGTDEDDDDDDGEDQ